MSDSHFMLLLESKCGLTTDFRSGIELFQVKTHCLDLVGLGWSI